jgi:hypothetical protein
MHYKRALIVAFLIPGIATAAAPPPSSLTHAIIADVKGDDARLSDRQVRSGLRPVNINHDDLPDYLFSFDKIAGWCGSGGCRAQLWIQRRSLPPRKVFDGQVRETAFRKVRGQTVVDFDLHGSVCHTFGAAPCPASFVWNPKLDRLVEHPAPNGDGTIRLLRPTKAVDGPPPSPVAKRFRETLRACTAAAGTAADPEQPLTVPDVDGDGLRDWMIPEIFCDTPGDTATGSNIPMTLFASSGRPDRPVEAARGGRLQVSVAASPAKVFLIEAAGRCDVGDEPEPACRPVPLHWQPTARRFVR